MLLDYLVAELEECDLEIFYLFDDRCIGDFGFIPDNRKAFVKAGIVSRFNFYNKHSNKFSKIICFGNLPPLKKYKNKSTFTYFHQTLFLSLPDSFPYLKRILFLLKTAVVYLLKSNTDYWVVQSNHIKNKLSEKFALQEDQVLVYPFYPPLVSEVNTHVERRRMSFLYVSNAGPHKNHYKLIDEFVKFYDEYKVGSLTLTIDKSHEDLYFLILSLSDQGYPIYNCGFIPRNMLPEIYKKHEYLIFPSLSESFGLGIVEAVENGCKIIGADLPYLHEVCQPSLVFDPYQKDSIYNALRFICFNNLDDTKQLVYNRVNDFIKRVNE